MANFINSTYTSDIIIDFLISTSNKALYSNTSVYNTSSSIVSTDVNTTNFETSPRTRSFSTCGFTISLVDFYNWIFCVFTIKTQIKLNHKFL